MIAVTDVFPILLLLYVLNDNRRFYNILNNNNVSIKFAVASIDIIQMYVYIYVFAMQHKNWRGWLELLADM